MPNDFLAFPVGKFFRFVGFNQLCLKVGKNTYRHVGSLEAKCQYNGYRVIPAEVNMTFQPERNFVCEFRFVEIWGAFFICGLAPLHIKVGANTALNVDDGRIVKFRLHQRDVVQSLGALQIHTCETNTAQHDLEVETGTGQ